MCWFSSQTPVTARELGLGQAGTRSLELKLDLHVNGRAWPTEPAVCAPAGSRMGGSAGAQTQALR